MSSAGEMTGLRSTSEARDLEPRGQLVEPVHLSLDFSHVTPSPLPARRLSRVPGRVWSPQAQVHSEHCFATDTRVAFK